MIISIKSYIKKGEKATEERKTKRSVILKYFLLSFLILKSSDIGCQKISMSEDLCQKIKYFKV